MLTIKHKRGFTIVELLVVISLFMLISSIVMAPLAAFRNGQILTLEAENIMSLLTQARSDTLASKFDSQYGVHFEATRIMLFKGTTFTEPHVDNIEVTFDTRVTLSGIVLSGGGSDIVFTRLIGKTTQDGTLTLSLPDNASTTRAITVYSTGSMDRN